MAPEREQTDRTAESALSGTKDPADAEPIDAGAEDIPRGYFDLGIVFVHGMGDTKPGDTLIRFLNPTVEWIKRWANRDYTVGLPGTASTLTKSVLPVELPNSGSPTSLPTIDRVDHTLLRSSDVTERNITPPHSVITLRRDDGSKERKRWLAVEAWWADEFTPPKFGQVATWALGLTPYIIARHFKPPIESNRWWILIQPFRYLLALLIIVLFEFSIVILLLAGSIPFLQNYVKKAILSLIGSFGDVLIYTADAVRATAIRGAVERSISWIEHRKQCEKLVIVGYSLGSLIGYDVLNRRELGASSFVTFGSPLKKASVALQLQRNEQRTSLGIVTAVLALLLMVSAAITAYRTKGDWTWTGSFTSWQWWLFLLCLGACAGVILRRFSSRELFSGLTALLCVGAISVGIGWPRALGGQSDPIRTQGNLWLQLGATSLALAAALVIPRWIRERGRPRRWEWLWHGSSPCFLLATLIVAGFTLFVIDTDTGVTWIAPLVLASIALAWSAADLPRDDILSDATPELQIAGPPGVGSWLDFWATGDPITEYGLQSSADNQFQQVDSKRITNRRSVLSDHSIYSENPEQFIAPLADHLLTQTDPTWTMFGVASDMSLLEKYQTERRGRVTWLGVSFWLTMLIPLLISIVWYRETFKRYLFESVESEPTLRFLNDDWFWTEYLNNHPFETAPIIGFIVTVLAALLWYKLVEFTTWRFWDRAVERDLFERKTTWSINRSLRAFAFFAVGIVAPVVLTGWVVAHRGISWVGYAASRLDDLLGWFI